MEYNQAITAESRNVEIEECGNISTISRRANSGKRVERLEIKFGGNKYGTQLTRTGKRKYH